MPLTDVQVRRLQPRDKPYKLYDGGGLHIVVVPNGKRYWRMRYQLAGREGLLSIGPYPEIGIAAARRSRDDAKAELRAGRDPAAGKRLAKLRVVSTSDTFEARARRWHRQQTQWRDRHRQDVIESLERHVFPAIGRLHVADISVQIVAGLVNAINGPETARRVRQRISSVFQHVNASGMAVPDPAAVVKAGMRPVPTPKPRPALTDLDQLRAMLQLAEAQPAHPTTLLAMRLLALTAVRPGEVQGLLWTEIDGNLWTIPAERMKMKREHLVPLSRQGVETVEAMTPLSGRSLYVFPSHWSNLRSISENALSYLLLRSGYQGRHVPHGWRASFSSIMNERHRADRAVIDLMLAHSPSDRTEAAYNRALYLNRRREIAQEWADLLLEGFPPPSSLLTVQRR